MGSRMNETVDGLPLMSTPATTKELEAAVKVFEGVLKLNQEYARGVLYALQAYALPLAKDRDAISEVLDVVSLALDAVDFGGPVEHAEHIISHHADDVLYHLRGFAQAIEAASKAVHKHHERVFEELETSARRRATWWTSTEGSCTWTLRARSSEEAFSIVSELTKGKWTAPFTFMPPPKGLL